MLKFSEYTKQPVVKQLNENVVQKGNILTVTFTYDMSMDVVEEYRKKVKSEDDKNLLVQFSGAVIAEKMIKYTLDQFMTVDNIPSDAFIDSAKEEGGPEVGETNSAAEEPKEEPAPTEPKKEETEKTDSAENAGTIIEDDSNKEGTEVKKEEEEEESNYLNLYTTMGQPVSTGFKLNSPTHKSPKNAKVGLYEGLTDKDLK